MNLRNMSVAILFNYKNIEGSLYETIPVDFLLGELKKSFFNNNLIFVTKNKSYNCLNCKNYFLESFGYPISSWEIFNSDEKNDNQTILELAKVYYDEVSKNRYFVNVDRFNRKKFYKLLDDGSIVNTDVIDSYKYRSNNEEVLLEKSCNNNDSVEERLKKFILDEKKGNKIVPSKLESKSFDIKADSSFNDFDLTKSYDSLRNIIISQDVVLKEVLLTVKDNIQKINLGYPKSNILLIGATGTGKTLIANEISKILNVPFVQVDANNYTQLGYVGENISDCLKALYLKSGYNRGLTEHGIVFIDEFDKLAKKNSDDFVKTVGVQQALLKLLEGQEYRINMGQNRENITIDSTNVTFIAAGAFMDLTVPKKNNSLGFLSVENTQNTLNRQNVDQCLINYGIEAELVGRFSRISLLNNLDYEDLKKIIFSENSIFNYYLSLFKKYNINFIYDDTFIEAVARCSMEKFGGARGINKVLEYVFSECLWEMYAKDVSGMDLTVNADIVNDPKKYILK